MTFICHELIAAGVTVALWFDWNVNTVSGTLVHRYITEMPGFSTTNSIISSSFFQMDTSENSDISPN